MNYELGVASGVLALVLVVFAVFVAGYLSGLKWASRRLQRALDELNEEEGGAG